MERCYEAKFFLNSYDEKITLNYGFAFLIEENSKKYLKVILTNDFMIFDLDSDKNKVIVKYYAALEDGINILAKMFERRIPKSEFEIPFKLKLCLDEEFSVIVEVDYEIQGKKKELYKKQLMEFELSRLM